MKTLLKFILALSLTACGASLEKPSTDSFVEEEEQEVSWENCAQQVGSHPCDFTLRDQHDNDVSLYDFYGSIVVLDLSAMWCAPCQAAAKAAEDVVDSYGHDKVQWVTILIEDSQGNAPDLDDLQAWASAYHGSSPIIAGDRSLIDVSGNSGFPLTSWPTFLIIDKGLNVKWILKGWGEEEIRLLIEDVLKN